MKVFISQPMRGREQSEILKERELIAARLENEGYEVEDALVSCFNTPGKNNALRCLGMALTQMAECDCIYMCNGWEATRGCNIEYEAALSYGLTVLSK